MAAHSGKEEKGYRAKRNGISKGRAVLLLALAFLVSATLTFLLYSHFVLLGSESTYAQVETSNILGITTDNDSLQFGLINPGGSVTRSVRLTNRYSFSVQVLIFDKGAIAPILSHDNNVLLAAGETKELFITVQPPDSAGLNRNYTGTLTFVYKRKLV